MLLSGQGGRAVGSSGVFDRPESLSSDEGLLLRSWEGVPSVFEVAVRGGGGGLGGLEGSIVGAGSAAAPGGEGEGEWPVGVPAEGLAAEEGDDGEGGLEVDGGVLSRGGQELQGRGGGVGTQDGGLDVSSALGRSGMRWCLHGVGEKERTRGREREGIETERAQKVLRESQKVLGESKRNCESKKNGY